MMLLIVALVSFAAAVIPMLFYAYVAWSLDHHEKEPLWLLAVTFLWGAVPAVVLSLFAELLFDVPLRLAFSSPSAGLLSVALVAPIVEEIFKAIPLVFIFIFFRHEFDGLMDGLLYGALVGFGFAMTENFFYFLGSSSQGGAAFLGTIVLRAFVFGLNHALYSSMFGLGLALARYATSQTTRALAPLGGLALAIFIHMLHNFLNSTGSLICLGSLFVAWGGVLGWLALVWWALREEAKLIRQELQDEVESGLLTPRQVAAAASYRARMQARNHLMRNGQRQHARLLDKIYLLAAELAFKKRQFRLLGNENGNVEIIAALRQEIANIQEALYSESF